MELPHGLFVDEDSELKDQLSAVKENILTVTKRLNKCAVEYLAKKGAKSTVNNSEKRSGELLKLPIEKKQRRHQSFGTDNV